MLLSETKITCEKCHDCAGMECVDEYFEEGLFHDWYVEVWRCPKCGRRVKTRRKTDKAVKDSWSRTENRPGWRSFRYQVESRGYLQTL